MSGDAVREGGTVTLLRGPTQATRERVREIETSFPGWKVFHSSRQSEHLRAP